MSEPGPVVVTGAAGRVARLLRPALLAAGHQLRLTDRLQVVPLAPGETFMRARFDRPRRLRRVLDGAAALVHLGGVAAEAEWSELIAANVAGTAACFEAARQAGVRRIVFASSMHSLGMVRRDEAIDEASLPAPDSRYAVTKIFGEAACRMMGERHGLSATAIRIGHVVEDIRDAAPGQGITAADLGRIVLLALGLDTPGFRLFHAVAPHPGYPQSDGRLERDHGFAYAHSGPDRDTVAALLAADPTLDASARACHGGDFIAGRRAAPR